MPRTRTPAEAVLAVQHASDAASPPLSVAIYRFIMRRDANRSEIAVTIAVTLAIHASPPSCEAGLWPLEIGSHLLVVAGLESGLHVHPIPHG